MRKSLVALMAIIVVLSITLTACKSESGQNIVSKALGIDVSSGNEVSSYDTHSGNGDGTSCIALSFNDDTVLEKSRIILNGVPFLLMKPFKLWFMGLKPKPQRTARF